MHTKNSKTNLVVFSKNGSSTSVFKSHVKRTQIFSIMQGRDRGEHVWDITVYISFFFFLTGLAPKSHRVYHFQESLIAC